MSDMIQIGGSNSGAVAQGANAVAVSVRVTKDYQPGDTVRLRSGGPLMTVLESGEPVRCAWFQGKENREGSFPAAALDHEEPAWKKAGE